MKKKDESLATEIEDARQRLNVLLRDAWMEDLKVDVEVVRFKGEVRLVQVAIHIFREVEPVLTAPRRNATLLATPRNGNGR